MQGVIVATIFLLSNVVAAVVFLLLGLTLQAIAPTWVYSPWPWLVIGIPSVVASVVFIGYAVPFVAEYIERWRK